MSEVIESRASVGSPHVADKLGILPVHYLTQRFNMHLKVRNELAIKLNETDEARNVAHLHRGGPMHVQVVFRHGWPIPIRQDINAYKLETLRKKMALT